MDILFVNGKMEELNISMEGGQGSFVGAVKKSEVKTSYVREGTTVFDVQCSCSDGGPTGRVVAEIPPRYFGLRVKCAGNVVVQADMKEAQIVSIEAEENIRCKGALSSESMQLVSHGSVEASNIMANACSINTKSSHTSGAISIGRSSCLKLLIDAGKSSFEADSLICSNAQVNAGSIMVKNVNTLDGHVHFGVSPSQNPTEVILKGMDGQVSIGVEPSEEEIPLKVDIQLNENAKSLILQGDSPIVTTLHAPEGLDIMLESGDELKQHCGTDRVGTSSCKVVVPPHPHNAIRVNRRSWFDAFRESSGYNSL